MNQSDPHINSYDTDFELKHDPKNAFQLGYDSINTGLQNPFIITKYSGLDPEINGGIDATIYPRQKQVLFGANVKF